MSNADRPKPLSAEEARQLTEHLAVLANAGVPLAPALCAAAAEIPSRRLAEAMSALAAELEAGRSLEMILAANPRFVPDHMRRLIETGIRSGNLSDVLVQLVDIDQTSVDLRRSIRLAVAYPLVLVVLAVALVAFLALYVIPGFSEIFADFKTQLPIQTKVLIWLSAGHGLNLIVGALIAALVVIVGMRFALSDYGWCWLVIRIPLVGPMLLWRGVADWSRLAALLLEQGLSLPESLGLAATGTRDPFIAAQGTVDCPVGRYGNQAGGHLELGTRNAEIAGAACQLGRNARCAPRCISHGGGNVRKSSAIALRLVAIDPAADCVYRGAANCILAGERAVGAVSAFDR